MIGVLIVLIEFDELVDEVDGDGDGKRHVDLR